MPFVSFLVFVLITSFTPGLNNILSMSIAARYGFRKSLRFNFGVAAGFFVLALLCCYFNLLLHQYVPKIEFAMSVAGSLYLLYLAYRIMRSKSAGSEGDLEKTSSFLHGAALQFINPKGIMYGITAASAFILPFDRSTVGMIVFSAFLAIVAFLSTASWAMFGSFFQTFLRKYERPFQTAMGLSLVYCAISILL